MPYSARVSILVEIAEKADVSVEGVVRVLTREPVSEAVKERVLAVLDDLTPEQTRAVQRFALAALHDVLLRPGDAIDLAGAPAADESTPPRGFPPPRTGSDAAFVQLGSVLGELAEAVRDLRRETDAERRERVDDLAVLIDLITTGWQGLDARLGRIEKQVSRLEAGRREPMVIAPARVVPTAVEPPPRGAAQPRGAHRSGVDVESSRSSPRWRSSARRSPRSPCCSSPRAARTCRGSSPRASTPPGDGRGELDDVGAHVDTGRDTPGGDDRPAARPEPRRRRRRPRTSSGRRRPRRRGRSLPPRRRRRRRHHAAAATTRPATTAASPRGFQPTRNWAWAPVKNAAYYDVVFTRAGKVFYAGSPTEPRLTLPSSLVFRPGAYRWVVRPGFGVRAAKNLGPPVVDSPFTVS